MAVFSFKSVFNFGNLLAITPPYNFKRHMLEKNIYFKLYVIVSVIFLIIGVVLSMLHRAEKIQAFRTSVIFTDALNELTLLGAHLAIKLDLGVFKAKKWDEVFKLMHLFNEQFSSKTDKKTMERFLTAQIIITHFSFIGVTVFQWEALIRTQGVGVDFVATYVIHYLSYYKITYVLVIMNAVLFSFEKKFRILNSELYRQLNVSITKHIGEIRRVEFWYRKLSDAVAAFNAIFGLVIILTLINFVINVIVMINLSLISNNLGPHADGSSYKDVPISNILATCFAMGLLLFFVFLCQRVVTEAQKTLKLCYELQEELPTKSDVRDEVWKLISVVRDKTPVFTAAGFFELNKSTLLSIFSTVTTYVIVLIQINMSMF